MKTKFRLFLLLLLLSMLAGAVFASGPAPAEMARQEAAHQPSLFEFSWVVLISQAINFFVLLFILNHFLFRPLGKILDERRESIGKIRINAEEEHRTALALKEVYEKHLANIEQEAYEIKQQAIHDANMQTAEIVLEAKLKAERIIEEGEMQLFNERQAAWMQLREEVVHLTMVAAERVVEQSLNDDIHRKLIKNTIERLETELPYHVADD